MIHLPIRQYNFFGAVRRGLHWCGAHAIVLFTGVLCLVGVLQYWAFIESERASSRPPAPILQ